VLTALSPLTVRRPGKALLDLRGTGLRPDLRARVVPLRDVPRGITVARQKWVSANLVTVLLELDAGVTPGSYAIVLEDPAAAGEAPAVHRHEVRRSTGRTPAIHRHSAAPARLFHGPRTAGAQGFHTPLRDLRSGRVPKDLPAPADPWGRADGSPLG
jgi:hypothetical protein